MENQKANKYGERRKDKGEKNKNKKLRQRGKKHDQKEKMDRNKMTVALPGHSTQRHGGGWSHLPVHVLLLGAIVGTEMVGRVEEELA